MSKLDRYIEGENPPNDFNEIIASRCCPEGCPGNMKPVKSLDELKEQIEFLRDKFGYSLDPQDIIDLFRQYRSQQTVSRDEIINYLVEKYDVRKYYSNEAIERIVDYFIAKFQPLLAAKDLEIKRLKGEHAGIKELFYKANNKVAELDEQLSQTQAENTELRDISARAEMLANIVESDYQKLKAELERCKKELETLSELASDLNEHRFHKNEHPNNSEK